MNQLDALRQLSGGAFFCVLTLYERLVSMKKHSLRDPWTTIRTAVAVHGIDTVELAERSGLHRVQISRLLNGHCRLTESANALLANALRDAIVESYPREAA